MGEAVNSNSKSESTVQSESDTVDEIVIDYELVQIEIRYALLVSICITSSLVTLIIELGLLMLGPKYCTNIAFLLVSSDVFLNSFCLCLLYDKDKTIVYDKLCLMCHSKCRIWRINQILKEQGLNDETSVQFKNLMVKE